MKSLWTSITVALWTAALSTVIGTSAALGLERMRGPVRAGFDAMIYIAIMVPGVVIGIATLISFVTIFNLANPGLAAIFGENAPKLQMGRPTIIAAHVLFNLAVVILLIRSRLAGMDRALVEASEDLYAGPLATFRQITLPLLLPALVAGFLLAFTFSFEDFIIAFFVAGPNNTLPIYVFSSIRRGITPEINAIGTVVLTVSLTLLIAAQLILRQSDPSHRARASE